MGESADGEIPRVAYMHTCAAKRGDHVIPALRDITQRQALSSHLDNVAPGVLCHLSPVAPVTLTTGTGLTRGTPVGKWSARLSPTSLPHQAWWLEFTLGSQFQCGALLASELTRGEGGARISWVDSSPKRKYRGQSSRGCRGMSALEGIRLVEPVGTARDPHGGNVTDPH